MKVIRAVVTVSAILLLLLCSSDETLAQVPRHAPGTVCLTPQFWCWAQPPGTSGARCFCQTPLGRVGGVLG
jgi:hypothetical protein